jgi:hypothetical protein
MGQQEPMQPNSTQVPPSPRTPAFGSPDERIAAFFARRGEKDPRQFQTYKSNLKQIWTRSIEDWALARRMKLMRVLRAIEYNKGNQYISWDPFSCCYYDALDDDQDFGTGNQQASDSAAVLYQQKANIIQWLRRVWTSHLGAGVPRVEWWPGDSESDLDNRASHARGRAYRKIAGDNQDKGFLALCLDYLFLTGSYFVQSNWSMDKALTGTHYEPIMGWAGQPVLPNRYVCPNCGQSTPANVQSIQGGVKCVGCGAPLGSANFYPAKTIKMPVVTGQREVPNGQVRWNAWNVLNFEVMPQASAQTGGVINNTPIGDLSCLITKGAFRRMYPDAWDLIQSSDSDTSARDADISRIAQVRALTPGSRRGLTSAPDQLTYHRVWFQPDAIYSLEAKKEDVQRLADVIGDGCVGVFQGDNMIDIEESIMRKVWTWCGAEEDAGAYPPAPVEPALDFQDSINDRINSINQYQDRCGTPPIFYNQRILGEGLNGKYCAPGLLMGLPVNQDLGFKLEDAMFQPTFHQDSGAPQWVQELLQLVQMLVGVNPQMWGGAQKGVDTAKGQKQALDTAQAAQGGYFQAVVKEWTTRANLSVQIFADNATDDEYHVTKSDDAPEFANEPIRLADLRGEADARPEANQDYPIDWDQQRALMQELLGMASGKEPNPLVMEILDTFENRRLVMGYLGPPDMELPEAVPHEKVLEDIVQLMKGKPAPGQDPASGQPILFPSVQPDKIIDGPTLESVTIPTCIRYAQKNYMQKLQNPNGWQNLILYITLAKQFTKEIAAENAMPPGGMPPPGQGAPPGAPAAQPAAQ